ncbi:MAG: leucine-rich repeat domain-containing protein, partial [Roseinatronobacter sp.]
MSDADTAYELAKQKIADAISFKSDWLDFSGEAFRALEQLPPELGELVNLRHLSLDGTNVEDISVLSNSTNLESLSLNSCQVGDLRPVANMRKLAWYNSHGLRFRNTPATNWDTKLEELSKIEDDEDRVYQTLTYLRSLPPWPDPYTPAATPDGRPPQPIGGQTSSPKQFAPLTLETILTAQTPLGWRFSPDHGTMILYVEEQPLTAFQEQFAKMTADRLGGLLKLVGNANFGIRGDLRDEAERFDALLKDESRSLSLRSLELWGSLVALGSLLDANDDARRNGQDPLDLMAPQQRASLQTLLQVAGNLVRSFPDVQKLDDSAGGFLRKEVTLEIVAQLIDTAISTRFVDLQSAALMQHVKQVADSPGKQGDKAASATTRGASNMALTAAMIVRKPLAIAATGMAVGAAAQVGSEIA